MKNRFRLIILTVCFSISIFLPRLNADSALPFLKSDVRISMDFQDANLKDVLKVLSIQSNLNFIASEALQDRKITLYLDKVPIKVAMDKIFKANNLSYELDRDANIFIVQDWGKPQIETVTKVFFLKHATVSSSSLKDEMGKQIAITPTEVGGGDGGGGSGSGGGTTTGGKWTAESEVGITRAVKKILSEFGSVIEDYRTNSLVVTDIPSRMPVIAQTIATLDVPIPQVMLEVEMLDVSKKIVDKLGFNWSQAGTFSVTLVPATAGTWFPFGNLFHRDGGGPTRSTNNAAGKLSFSSFTLALDYLRTQTDTKYLARPRLLTLNNETAEIKIVTEESIGVKTTEVSTTGSTSAEPERAETGVLLRVTPQINSEAGEITMFIYPQVSEATTGQSIQTPDGNYLYRDPEIRSTKSMVRVKDGDTVIVGGLIRNEFTQTITKVPILGDIPIIGALFRSKGGSGTNFANDKDRERELLVFITPHIIKDTSMELAQAKKVPIPEREQSAVSVGDRQAAVATSLNNFEKKKK